MLHYIWLKLSAVQLLLVHPVYTLCNSDPDFSTPDFILTKK
jgi:hypothetical protein